MVHRPFKPYFYIYKGSNQASKPLYYIYCKRFYNIVTTDSIHTHFFAFHIHSTPMLLPIVSKTKRLFLQNGKQSFTLYSRTAHEGPQQLQGHAYLVCPLPWITYL